MYAAVLDIRVPGCWSYSTAPCAGAGVAAGAGAGAAGPPGVKGLTVGVNENEGASGFIVGAAGGGGMMMMVSVGSAVLNNFQALLPFNSTSSPSSYRITTLIFESSGSPTLVASALSNSGPHPVISGGIVKGFVDSSAPAGGWKERRKRVGGENII